MVMGHRLEEAAAHSLAPDPFAPKDGAGFHSFRDQGGSLLDFSGVEFSTDTAGSFQSELWTLRLETVIHVLQVRKALQVSQDGRSRTRLLDSSCQGVAG
jgi:hypothetical protein